MGFIDLLYVCFDTFVINRFILYILHNVALIDLLMRHMTYLTNTIQDTIVQSIYISSNREYDRMGR